MVVWFTGLSGAGKTTLAAGFERRLSGQGTRTYLLDDDVLRSGLCRDLRFSIEGRRESIRRAGTVAQIVADAGLVVLVALISPLRLDRAEYDRPCCPGSLLKSLLMPRCQSASNGMSNVFKKRRGPV